MDCMVVVDDHIAGRAREAGSANSGRRARELQRNGKVERRREYFDE
jgi:hypothetical protein